MFALCAVSFLVLAFFTEFGGLLSRLTVIMVLVIPTLFLVFLLLTALFVVLFAGMFLVVVSFRGFLVLVPNFVAL